MERSPKQTRFKNLEPERESPNRTISASGGLGPLQIISELGTEQRASEEAEPQRGWTRGGMPARTLDSEGGELEGPTSIGEGNECQRGCWA